MWVFCFSCSIPPPPPPPPPPAASSTINTTPSTQHHQHNTINTQHHRSTWSTSVSFCVAGAALGAPQACFAWQAQHFIELSENPATSDDFGRRVVLRGRRSTWSTSGSFCMAGAALGAPQVVLRGRRWSTSSSSSVAGAALGAPQARFARQAQHLEHLRLGFAWQAQHSEHLRSFCVAGAGAPQARLPWQAQHLEHLRLVLRGRCSTWSTFIKLRGSPATNEDFGRLLVLPGRRSTWSTSGSFCVACAALGGPQSHFA